MTHHPDEDERARSATVAQWAKDPPGSPCDSPGGGDDPYDPSRYWDIYDGTD